MDRSPNPRRAKGIPSAPAMDSSAHGSGVSLRGASGGLGWGGSGGKGGSGSGSGIGGELTSAIGGGGASADAWTRLVSSGVEDDFVCTAGARGAAGAGGLPYGHFLDACFLCRKPIASNRDIYMYRSAFAPPRPGVASVV